MLAAIRFLQGKSACQRFHHAKIRRDSLYSWLANKKGPSPFYNSSAPWFYVKSSIISSDARERLAEIIDGQAVVCRDGFRPHGRFRNLGGRWGGYYLAGLQICGPVFDFRFESCELVEPGPCWLLGCQEGTAVQILPPQTDPSPPEWASGMDDLGILKDGNFRILELDLLKNRCSFNFSFFWKSLGRG